MISRLWRGLAKASRADDYVAHLREETFGPDAELAVVPAVVVGMMSEFDSRARHFESLV